VAGLGVEGQQQEQAPGREEMEAEAAIIEQALRLLCLPGYAYELRAFPSRAAIGNAPDDLGELAALAAKWSADEKTEGVYLTVNPRPPRAEGTPPTHTKDADITKRAWFYVDFDCERPNKAENNATAEEKEKGKAKALEVRDYLRGQGWPEPVLADSGNGYHLLFRIDRPNDDDAKVLVRNVLRALAARFDTDAVKVDQKVFNASRITKLYGTIARKGEDTPERPWRKSAILEAPAPPEPVRRELLEVLAAEAPASRMKGGAAAEANRVDVGGVSDPPHRTTESTRPPVLKDLTLAVAKSRAKAYIAEMPDSVSGQNGHDALFDVACVLVRGFLLTPRQAFPILGEYNESRCHPKWEREDLIRKLRQAETKSTREWGYILNAEQDDGASSHAPTRNGRTGKGRVRKTFPEPVDIDAFVSGPGADLKWVWNGFLAAGHITVLSALWKCGKTTFLTYLLKALSGGEAAFCGLELCPGKVLVITQEAPATWKRRRDKYGLGKPIKFQVGEGGQPNPGMRQSRDDWDDLCFHLAARVKREGFALVVIDTLADFWPVQDENAAGQVTDALVPLKQVTAAGAAVLLVHHSRKGGGTEGVSARGSGQLGAFVDISMELRRDGKEDKTQYEPRKLRSYSRFEETPHTLTLLRTEDGYVVQQEGQVGSLLGVGEKAALLAAVAGFPDGATFDGLRPCLSSWGEKKLRGWLSRGATEGWLHMDPGAGTIPNRYFVPPPESGPGGEAQTQ
jgi:hypothetical protein